MPSTLSIVDNESFPTEVFTAVSIVAPALKNLDELSVARYLEG